MISTAQKNSSFIPIYQRLADEYREAIIMQQLKPGDRIDSINEIMHKHQVSRETAKLILKILAKDGMIVQRAGKGSFVANLAPMKKLWGVILPFFSIQYQELLYNLSQQAWSFGRQLNSFIDYDNWEEEIRLVGQLINDRYEAIIIIPTFDESKTASFYRSLSSRESHVALVDHTMAGSSFSYVIQSYDLGVQRGARYLLEKSKGGNVAFIRNEVTVGRNLVQELMEATFTTVISAKGNIRSFIIDRVANVNAAFIKDNDIRGIFCCDDSDAIRTIGRLKEQGIFVDSDYSLISYGNTDLARYFTPAITSIDPHSGEMADKISNIIRNKIEEIDTAFSQYVVQPDLIVRDT